MPHAVLMRCYDAREEIAMLINCAVYQEGRKLSDIQPREIHEYVRRPECFVWVALYEPTPEELETMQQEFGLHELAVEDARHGHQRPKIEEYGDSLFVVLHTVELAGDELRHRRSLHIRRPQLCALGSQPTPSGDSAEVRDRSEREPDLLRQGSAYVLYAIMDTVVDRYFPVLDALEAELEEVESRYFLRQ